MPTQVAEVPRELVLGSVYNDAGGVVEAAEIVVESSDTTFNRTIEARGGAFSLREVPVGTTLTLMARAPGYTSRKRTLIVRPVVPIKDEEPNRVDFGGVGPGYWYFLSQNPEITSTQPANLERDVNFANLDINFEFSHAIPTKEQGKFEDLLRVHVPGDTSGGAEPGILRYNTLFGRARARILWAEDGRSARFTFPMAPVANQDGTVITVDLDPEVTPGSYPKDENGRRLGVDRVLLTQDGAGSTVRNRVAAFARTHLSEPIPSARPSPLEQWGKTHMTSVRFTISRDMAPLAVTNVEALPGNGTNDDLFVLTFNKPVYGFPASAISASTTQASSFRYVVGNVSNRRDREYFEEADPKVSGSGIRTVELDENHPTQLLLHTSPGTFSDQNRFKLFVDSTVQDIFGVPLGGGGYQTEGNV